MFIECDKCQSKYEVPDSAFAEKGRKVKCKNCSNVWFQQPITEILEEDIKEEVSVNEEVVAEAEEQVKEEIVQEEAPQKEMAQEDAQVEPEPEVEPEIDALDEMPQGEDLEEQAEEVKEEVTETAVVEAAASEVAPNSVKGFFAKVAMQARMLTSTFNRCSMFVKHNYRNISIKGLISCFNAFYMKFAKSIFTVTSFATLMIITLAVLYTGREIVVDKFPAMYLLYKTAGLEIMAPGEGLEIKNFSAQYFRTRNDVSLKVKAEMINKTDQELLFPKLDVVLKDANNNIIKTISPEIGSKRVKANKSYPFTLEFSNVPENSAVAEIIAVRN